MTSSPPAVLASARLDLRAWRPADADALREALTESVEHLRPWVPWATPCPPTAGDVTARLATWSGDFAKGLHWVYAAWDRQARQLVGGAGLYGRVGPGALEIGYWIRRSRGGEGFATEASRALTAAGFALPGIVRLEMHCDVANVRSRRIPEKLGYRLTGTPLPEASPAGAARRLAIYVLEREAA